jgi:hypothetical protein
MKNFQYGKNKNLKPQAAVYFVNKTKGILTRVLIQFLYGVASDFSSVSSKQPGLRVNVAE